MAIVTAQEASSSTFRFKYDVFISFRGEDTCETFTDHLYTALVEAGLRTFRDDDDEIERGKRLGLELTEGKQHRLATRREAIEQSGISIIVLSKNYAFSKWCLDEVSMILRWRRNRGSEVFPRRSGGNEALLRRKGRNDVLLRYGGYKVLPIFYDVDPSDVRKQKGSIGEAFALYEEQFIHTETNHEKRKEWMEKLKGWRSALQEVASLAGMVFKNQADGREAKFIRTTVKIVEAKIKAAVKGLVPIQAETKDGRQSSIFHKQESSGSKEIPQSDDHQHATEICLVNSGLSKLPENLNFQGIEKLFLQLNPDLRKIPFSFFEHMPLLLVLNLSKTSIKSLPSSISSLVKLQELLLRDCELLIELPPAIGALGNLSTLDLEGTELICLPKEIGGLCNLKCLKVSFYKCADDYKESKGIETIIPRETLPKFSLLEELSIDVDPECVWWDAEVEAIIKDLSCLTRLETLKLYLPTVKLLQQFLHLKWHGKRKWRGDRSFSRIYPCLLHFRLIVGRSNRRLISRLPHDLQDKFEKLDRCLKYMNGDEHTADEIGKALKHASALFLDRHWTIDRLSAFKIDEMENLCFCLLVQCNGMKSIVDGNDFYNLKFSAKRSTLASLRYLSIHCMKNLESIWEGPIVSGCLLYLNILAVHTCPRLSAVFNRGLLEHLINLRELIVEDCCKMKSLVTVEYSSSVDPEFLPSLKKISLLHLPELVNISSGLWIARRLETLVVYDCPKLKSLSPMELLCLHMVKIKGEAAWWEQLEWHTWDGGPPNHFASIFVPFGRDDDLMDQLVEAVKTFYVFGGNLHSNKKNKEAMIHSDDSDIYSGDSGNHSDDPGVETASSLRKY